MASSIIFKLTNAGKAAAINADNTGVELKLTHVAFGVGFRNPNGTETAMVNEAKRVTIVGGVRVAPDQVRVNALWSSDVDESPIREIGIFAGSTLFAYWSDATGKEVGYKSKGVDFVFYYDLALKEIPANSVNVTIDPNAPIAMNAIAQHEQDQQAHPWYLRRSAVAQDADTLRWCGLAGGSADIITLTLPAESYFTSYRAGQSFRFLAKFGNSGPVSVNVNNLGPRSVRKNGTASLSSGDIVGGRLYEIAFDGSNFQISAAQESGGGNDYEGEVFYTHPFIATAGQTVFNAPYSVGALMVFAKGDFVQPSGYTATDGASVTLKTAAAAGDQVTIITFRATAAANIYTKDMTYTRAEVQNLLTGKQDNIGFTPVQQGGGVGQGVNKIRLGWNATYGLKAQVDNTDLGNFWYSGNFNPNTKADKATTLAGYGITNAYTVQHIDVMMAIKQDKLGYVPVRQGGGAGQLNNTVYIGWNGGALTLQVDNNASFGDMWYDGNGWPKVMNVIAGQNAGNVGTYALMTFLGGYALATNQLVSGSQLRWANTEDRPDQAQGGTAVGTWRCMGKTRAEASDLGTTVFLRVN